MGAYSDKRKTRIILLFCIMVALFTTLVLRLVKLQACEHKTYTESAKFIHSGTIEIKALRGNILDRNGTALATSLALPSICVNPSEVGNAGQTALYLSLALKRSKKEIENILRSPAYSSLIAKDVDFDTAQRVEKMKLPGIYIENARKKTKTARPSLPAICACPKEIKDPAGTARTLAGVIGQDEKKIYKELTALSTFEWIERKIDSKTAEKIQKLNLSGVFIQNEPTGKRFYPKNKVASHILGYAGIDDQGLEGTEANYNDLLAGKSGTLEAEVDEPGRAIPGGTIKYIPPVPGKDLVLTIDETVQYIVEKELDKVVKEKKAAGGSVIVYDPRNGEILALANRPDYSPANVYKYPKSSHRNRAVCDAYEPGSTFKIMLAASALDSGKVSLTDTFSSGASLQVGGYSLRNADDGLCSSGMETVEGVITYSFNTGAASIGLRLGSEIFSGYLDRLGFGRQTGIDLPGESEGMLAPGKYWKPINLATISYGQGISVTPIQMVKAYGALANEGVMMKPHVVKKILNGDGSEYKAVRPQSLGRMFKPKTCHDILRIMHGVCEKGTGKRGKVPGYTVGGKTGTANVVKNGVYVSDKYIVSFIGIMPVEDPRLVMLVKIDEPQGPAWGGTVAAPLFSKIGSQIAWHLGIAPSKPAEMAQAASEQNQ